MTGEVRTEDVGRLAPVVLGALVRRYGHFDLAEDAVQEALVAAATQWPADGRPDDPKAWLVRVASRRLVDALRSSEARARREGREAALTPADRQVLPAVDEVVDGAPSEDDDTLTLLLLCCHEALTPSSQVALTLRAVGGLTTKEIAAAFLVPERTMGQRIARAKATLARSGARFVLPPEDQLEPRVQAVLKVLYLIFNEGYLASTGAGLHRRDLAAEAVRLTRELRRLRPDDPEAAGLLALMLLTEARRPARLRDGALVPLDEQDRSLWDRAAIEEGVALVEATLAGSTRLGPYQLQAAIAAVHAEAPSAEETDWTQILALYDLLEAVAPNPVASLNRAVAVGEVHGPSAGLALLDELVKDDRIAGHHRTHAVRAFLLERAGDVDGARQAYAEAARRATSEVERNHLRSRAAALRS
ncbi:MAG TPA: sigma-70 family RNA polymerase sigma factor [Microthrixaceae bacterium]|mgnify:CR=1 FL=1|nr:sigma-70 family RNA polymerase sigma factor [Microthrixaceae bacterium]